MKHQPARQGQTTTPGTTCPALFDKCVGSLTSPANHVTLKMTLKQHSSEINNIEQDCGWEKLSYCTCTVCLYKFLARTKVDEQN